MRTCIVRAAVSAMLLLGTSLAFAFSTGPPASRTGAFPVANKAAELVCTVCHSGSPLNDPSGSLHLLDVPDQYTPGQIYNMRLVVDHTWNPLPTTAILWGFQLQAVQATTGDSAGRWILPPNAPPDTFSVIKGVGAYARRMYLRHTRADFDSFSTAAHSALHMGELSPITWNVQWQAPPGDSGKVYFFAASNSANGDGVSIGSGDFIFTTAESTIASGVVGVPHPSPLDLRFALEEPFPNPMNKCANIDFTVTRSGFVDLAIFDVQGRRMKTLVHDVRAPGTYGSFWGGLKEDGTYAKNGLYFLRLKAAGESRLITRKLTLAR